MKKLRLLVTKDCPRNCEGCCNKDWDLNNLPIVDHFNYDEILITGGEPLSEDFIYTTENIVNAIHTLFPDPNRRIYIYTSDSYGLNTAFHLVDGFTLTIHNQNDLKEFRWLIDSIYADDMRDEFIKLKGYPPSLRLKVFKGITIPEYWNLEYWEVRTNLEWIKDCPLPKDEEFKRLKFI